MPLNPENTYLIKGLKVRQYSLKKQSIPLSAALISIYYVAELPVRRSTLGEALVRENKYGRLPFAADYYVDKLGVWETLPVRMDRLAVVLCGQEVAARRNLKKLLKHIVEQRKVEWRSIEFKFRNRELEQEIKDYLADVVEPPTEIEFDNYDVEVEQPLSIKAEYQQYGNWTETPNLIEPISAIKITPSRGELKYRIHGYRSNWTKWVNNGEVCGIGLCYIDGFQFQYAGEGTFSYRCIFKNRATKWINTMQPQPYNIPILNIEFSLE